MGRWNTSPEAQATVPADFIVEMYIENDIRRYQKLSLCGPLVEEIKQRYNYQTNKHEQYSEATHAVVCCVMEVPKPRLEEVTSALRRSSKLRPAASYLVRAAEAADDASKLFDRLALLEAENAALRDVILDQADSLDQYDKNIETAEEHLDEHLLYRIAPDDRPPGKVGKRWTQIAKTTLAHIKSSEAEALKRMHNAINEKKAEVAAQLLARMPDDPT